MSLVPGAHTVWTREAWQDPRYPVFGPADTASNNDTIVIHYTAADDLIDGDPGEHAEDLPQYMRNMQYSYVTNRGYSLGYLFAVDWLGGIWQIRGWEYQSAANSAHNEHTWPILVLVDGADAATPEAVRSIQLIGYEAERRAGRPQAVKGHGQLRVETGKGTATACPGAGLQAQVNNGTFNPKGPDPDPLPVPPQPAPPIGDTDMLVALVQLSGTPHVYAQYSGGYKVWVRDGDVYNMYAWLSGKGLTVLNSRPLFEATGPIMGDRPSGVDAYGLPV